MDDRFAAQGVTPLDDGVEQFESWLVGAAKTAELIDSREAIRVGDTLVDGRFTIESQLGAGGMGRVLRAYDRELGRAVALKTFTRAHPTEILRIKKEFRALAHVSHRNLITLHELFVDEDRWFFTMPLIEGSDLCGYLRRHGEPRVEEVYAIFRQLAEGVVAIHDAGKLHCDLKPQNVLVSLKGCVVILDFGITVDVVLDSPNAKRMREGTPAYMAPEQAAGQAAPASDWYAVGVMLYEVLHDRLPWAAVTVPNTESKQDSAPRTPRVTGAWPQALLDLCAALLDRDPTRRPGDAEVIARLDITRPERGTSLQPAGPSRGATIGRARELQRLRHAFDEGAQGRVRGVVLVCGPSGIGKTHLINHLLTEVASTGRATVFRGRCFEREALPYRAFDTLIDAISDHLATLSSEVLRAVLPPDLRFLSRMFPVLQRFEQVMPRGAVVIGEVHTIRRRAVLALHVLLDRLSQQTPVVLHLDDLHWGGADDATLLMELLAVPADTRHRVLWLGSYRAEDKGRVPFLELVSPQHCETIELAPLGAEAALELARTLLPAGDAGQLAAVARESQGNPFFLSALIAHAESNDDGAPAPAPNLSHVLEARCARLPASGLHLLRVVAFAGQPIARELAHGAAGLRVEPEILAILRNSGLIRLCYAPASNALECFHDRIREEVVRATPQPQAQAIRLRLAEELEQHTPEQAELIMHHYVGAGLPERAAPQAKRAAYAAEQALAFEQAVTLYERAVQLARGSDQERCALRVRWAQALANTGRGAQAAEQFVLAAASSRGRDALDLERRAAHELLVTGHLEAGSRLLRKVVRSAGLPDPEGHFATTVALIPRALLLQFGRKPSMAPPRRALSDEQRFALDVCWSAAWSFSAIDTLKFGLYSLEFIRHAGRSGDPRLVSRARATLGVVLASNGDARYEDALRELSHAKQIAPDAETQAYVALSEAGVYGQTLRFAPCLEAADAAYATYSQLVSGAHYEKVLARAWGLISLTTLGRMGALEARVNELKRDLGAKGDLYANAQAAVYQLVARTVVDQGVEDALRELESTLDQLAPSIAFILRPALIHGYLYLGRLDEGQAVRRRYQRELREHGRASERLISTLEAKRSYAWLSIACARAGSRADLQRESRVVGKIERWMRRQNGDVPRCYAEMQTAGIASARGDTETEITALKAAAEIAGRGGLAACEAVVCERLGKLLGGDEGQALRSAAAKYFHEHSFKNPRRFVAAFGLAPTVRS